MNDFKNTNIYRYRYTYIQKSVNDFKLILGVSVFYHFLSIYKEDRHVALTAQSAVNATWRVGGHFGEPIGAPQRAPPPLAPPTPLKLRLGMV